MQRFSHYMPGEYRPLSMKFDGVSGGYAKEHNPSGQIVSAVGRFKVASFPGNGVRSIFIDYGSAISNVRLHVFVCGNSRTITSESDCFGIHAHNSAGTTILFLFSTVKVADDRWHSFLVSWNATTGAAVFKVDGVDVDDVTQSGRVLTTGTMSTVAGSLILVGNNANVPTANQWPGALTHLGLTEIALSNWSSFFFPDNTPKRLDESTWTEFVGQPLVYHPFADLENNLGSIGSMRRRGQCAPTLSGLQMKGSKDGPSNIGGIVFQAASPRVAGAAMDESAIQVYSRTGRAYFDNNWLVDANGYAYRNQAWAWWLQGTQLPAKASTTRLYQLEFRFEDATPPAGAPGVRMLFNYASGTNMYIAQVSWTGTAWELQCAQYLNSVWTTIETYQTFSTTIDWPIHGTLSVFDNGDDINIFAHLYEVDDAAAAQMKFVRGTFSNRPLKHETGFMITHHDNPNVYSRYRSMLIMDL